MQQETLWYLKNFNLFEQFSMSEMDKLSEMIRTEWIKRHDYVYLQGERPRWIYFLKEGLIKIEMLSAGGKTAMLDLLEPGEVFGELDLEDKSLRATQAVAVKDSLLCRISSESFNEMVRRHPGMILAVNKILGLRIRRIESSIQDLLFLNVPGRIAKLLIRLVESDGEEHPSGIRLKLRLTHQDIANLVAATREMVSMVIGNMVEENLILQENRHFIIISPKHLKKLYSQESR